MVQKYLSDGLRLLGVRGISESRLTRPGDNQNITVAHDSPDYHVAFPGLCVTGEGDLLCAFRQGLTHAGDTREAHIVVIKSSDEGATWSEPWIVADDPQYDDRNSAVETGPDGRVALCWDKYVPGGHRGACLAISEDGGRSFGPSIQLGTMQDVHTRSRPVWVDSDHIIVPLSIETGSADLPVTSYAIHVHLESAEQEIAVISVEGEPGPADETTIAYNCDGRLIALIRSCELPTLWQSESDDDGYTWTETHSSGIPSQYAPCDIVQTGGVLVCSFSFRQRRNERLVVSRDGGQSWDVENSVDIFAATPDMGDRSYVATVLMPSGDLGSVLYETWPHPQGGRIYFCRNSISQFDAERIGCLYADGTDSAAMLSVAAPTGAFEMTAAYRFTGVFGATPHEMEWQICGTEGILEMSYFMGATRDRWDDMTQGFEVALQRDSGRRVIARQAVKEIYCDGREHRLGLVRRGDSYALTVDGNELYQMRLPGEVDKLQLRAAGAAVAVYDVKLREGG